ncbi:peptide synthetase [Microbacterium sp.]|uniref:peptide synthetase n=1 Tax=Microbacterium sp. TaxID=51671 RepID=UPI003C731258
MRLTTVTQMSLPPGRLRSYAARVGDLGDAVPISFDQGRHVAVGDRPGSWMAFSFRVPEATSGGDLEHAWLGLIARHGTLRTVFTHDEGAIGLREANMLPGEWTEHDVPEGMPVRDVLRGVLDRICRPFARPSHALCVVRPAPGESDPRPIVIIAGDHSHLDMWSLAVAARDLLAALEEATDAAEDAAPVADAVAAFAEHTAMLAAAPPAPAEIAERWATIMEAGGGMMPAFPLDLGLERSPRRHGPPPLGRSPQEAQPSSEEPPRTTPPATGDAGPISGAAIVEVRDVLDADGLNRLEQRAAALGVRTLTLTISVLTEVTLRLAGQPLRVVFPVHSRHEPRWRDALGWFVTNSVLESDDPDPQACVARVREAVSLGGYPLGPLLEPYGGMRTPPGMFALSWLDLRRLPVPQDADLKAQYVSAAASTDDVMVWFVTARDGMHLRARYPDTPEATASVRRWLAAVEDGLRAHAAAGTTPGSRELIEPRE